jgi:hypothetical protein
MSLTGGLGKEQILTGTTVETIFLEMRTECQPLKCPHSCLIQTADDVQR